MMESNANSAWFYVDSSGNQKGPVTSMVLLKLYEKGAGGVNANSLVWQQNLTSWEPMSQVCLQASSPNDNQMPLMIHYFLFL
jgi:hypothetical protein